MLDKYTIIKNTNIVLLFCIIIFYAIYIRVKLGRKYISENFEETSNTVDDDVYVKFYDKVFDQKEVYEYNTEIISKYVNDKEYIKILDAGCGVGKHYSLLRKKYKDIIGIDRNNSFVKWAKIRNPHGTFIVDDFKQTNLFPKSKFSHITCLLDTIYHNNKEDMQNIIQNFKFWLKDDGFFIINLFIKDKLDPAPREFSQYYFDENKTKHSLTYFEHFTHDAWWNGTNYYQQYVNEDGKSFIKKHELHIEPVNDMLKHLDNAGFEVVDTDKYNTLDIKDMLLVICKKKV
jgi:SAM-dependent methyltransferase